MIQDPIFDEETKATLEKVMLESFRDYVARILGPSPFDFRGRHLMSKEQAEKTADELIAKMQMMPDKGAAFIRATFMPSTPVVDWEALNSQRNRKVIEDWIEDAKKPGG